MGDEESRDQKAEARAYVAMPSSLVGEERAAPTARDMGATPQLQPCPPNLTTQWPVQRYGAASAGGPLSPAEADALAVEEPLELRALHDGKERPLGVLMRTPDADRELLRGWLYAEGLWRRADAPELHPHPENPNVWHLHAPVPADYAAREISSACGICGSGSLERLLLQTEDTNAHPPQRHSAAWLAGLPDVLRAGQRGFGLSGGLHGAALFAPKGQQPLCLFEDVGRHNAADKVVGWLLQHGRELEPRQLVLVLSSRLGFEIVQKAALAGIGAAVGVGAATSLAAQGAALTGMLLCGFARGGRMTVYAGAKRLR